MKIINLLAVFVIPLVPNLDYNNPHFCTKSDKDFKEIRYNEIAVCNRSVTSSTRDKIYNLYNIPEEERSNYTIDHLTPLALGGSNNTRNLWPQHKSISSVKIEFETYENLRKGIITYQEALNTIMDFKLNRKSSNKGQP